MSSTETRSWVVTDMRSGDYAVIAAQSGAPVEALYMAGIETKKRVGQVEAATKGEAIVKAHLQWPRIPVEDLDVRPRRRAGPCR